VNAAYIGIFSVAQQGRRDAKAAVRQMRLMSRHPVLDAATADFKTSAQEFLDRADAVVIHDGIDQVSWANVSLKPVAGKPVFHIRPPQYVTPELIEFVRRKIHHRDTEEATSH